MLLKTTNGQLTISTSTLVAEYAFSDLPTKRPWMYLGRHAGETVAWVGPVSIIWTPLNWRALRSD
jgi:hypothetical protein